MTLTCNIFSDSAEDRQLSTTVSENIVPIFFLVLIAAILNNLLFGGLAASTQSK